MKKNIASALFGLIFLFEIHAQNLVRGIIIDIDSENPLHKVTVRVLNTNLIARTNEKGVFLFKNIPNGSYTLQISFPSYEIQNFEIELKGILIDLGTILLSKDLTEELDHSVITISEDELNSDEGYTDNIAGLLQSTKDVFLSAAAFDFSSTFFRPRGLDNKNGKVLINGIEMNKFLNGRPQWANWGGLNDLQRNQVFTSGLSPNDHTFGGIAGVNSVTMRASSYSEGGKISYASANRSYRGRIMGSYSSGISKNGWAYAFLISRRYSDEGFVDGTLYDSNSFFASVEKKIHDDHSLNFNLIYAQNRRGRSTALSNEIYQLKGRKYNPFWGEINGKLKNSRERSIVEPILMLNHYWDISENATLNTNISYQFGSQGNTRIDNGGTRLINFNGQDVFLGGAKNPAPDYYQNLPSYFLQDQNPSAFQYEQAFLAQQNFINDGQFNWGDLFEANQLQASQGYNSIYILQEDRIDDNLLSFSSILYLKLTDNIRLNASVSFRSLANKTYAKVKDLLGGTGFLDIDFFAEENQASQNEQVTSNLAQSDLQNPNRIVTTGNRYKYNYEVNTSNVDAFTQIQFNYAKLDFYAAININSSSYQRNGIYKNGYYPSASLGKGEKLRFNNYGVKSGLTYKINGQHLLDFNVAFITKAPTTRNSFENPRQNNNIIDGLKSEKNNALDVSYILRIPKVTAKITGYHINFRNGTNLGFFFTESGSTFTQEVVTNIERRNLGGELGIGFQVTPTIKLKGVASVGQYTYNNNPNVYYTSDDFTNNVTYGDGTSKLKNLHVSGGPERAFQLGFEYRDPDFWWLGVTANHFSNAYTNISTLKRTDAFAVDFDLIPDSILVQGGAINGYTYNDFSEKSARELLKQEKFNNYLLVNISGGKSWKLGNYYVGFFAFINNLFNQEYKTGGFEQSRRIGYRDQLQEQRKDKSPLFGNRYFFGNGTTYFLNFYIRF